MPASSDHAALVQRRLLNIVDEIADTLESYPILEWDPSGLPAAERAFAELAARLTELANCNTTLRHLERPLTSSIELLTTTASIDVFVQLGQILACRLQAELDMARAA